MLTEALEMASAAGTTSRRNVLIVDDDEAMADILNTRLSRQGFGTLVANSGRRALELARAEMPDCILLDLRLPDVDGFELCQQLVDSETTCDVPVIIVSGLERPDIIRRSRAAGCHYYVRKPYDPNALLTLIHQAIDEAKQDE
jgi:CheY-like chemotaxis protein